MVVSTEFYTWKDEVMVCELYFNKAVTLKKKVGFEKEESIG